jgi:hypothetical protein
MELIQFPRDIHTVCVQAESFPHGVMAAHKRLREKLPVGDGRRFFGISWPDGRGGISYTAAAEQRDPAEPARYGLSTFVIRQGGYASELLKNWRSREKEIGEIFQDLLKRPDIAPDGYCLEEYINDNDIRLMVTVK